MVFLLGAIGAIVHNMRERVRVAETFGAGERERERERDVNVQTLCVSVLR